MLSFIGLLAPRIANKLTGHDPRFSFSISGLLGGLLVLLADIAGRTLAPYPGEWPAGLFIAIVGLPYFVYLLIRRKSG